MKAISIQKLCLYSLTLLSLGFGGFTNEVHAKEHRLSLEDRFLRVEAIQSSIDTVNTFALTFSAAIRAEDDPTQQAILTQEVLNLFTRDFSITLFFGPEEITANDYNSLLALIQLLGDGVTFDSSLIGDFSVVDYSVNKHGRRTVGLEALQYVYQTIETGESFALVNLDDYIVVETKCDDFKIQSLVATVLTEIPLNSCPTGIAKNIKFERIKSKKKGK